MQAPISSSEALSILLKSIEPSEGISSPLNDAHGRILREQIICDRPSPPFDRVMMDGFAIKFDDWKKGTRTFSIHATQAAGDKAVADCPDNACIEIMTGAVLPTACDCIIPYEWTSKENNSITIDKQNDLERDQYIHKQGSDFSEGEVVLNQGIRLKSTQIGSAASFGYAQVKVGAIPRTAVICTGNELVPIDCKPEPQQIRQSNMQAVQAGLKNAGYTCETLAHLPDDEEVSKSSLEKLIKEHDFIIISGGISKGKFDYIPATLNKLGAECRFHGVKQRPGKPLGFWTLPGKYIITLPGNPVSTVTGLHQYVLPALRKYSGEPGPKNKMIKLAEDFNFPPPLSCFLPVKVKASGEAVPAQVSNSGDFGHLTKSDGYIELPAEKESFSAGESYPFTRWV